MVDDTGDKGDKCTTTLVIEPSPGKDSEVTKLFVLISMIEKSVDVGIIIVVYIVLILVGNAVNTLISVPIDDSVITGILDILRASVDIGISVVTGTDIVVNIWVAKTCNLTIRVQCC